MMNGKRWRRLKRRVRDVWRSISWYVGYVIYLLVRPFRLTVRFMGAWAQTRNFWHLLAGLPALAAGAGAVYLAFVVWLTPASALALRYRAEAAQRFQAKDFEGALICCERQLQLDQKRPEAVFDLVVALEALGRRERADVLLADLAPDNGPGHPPAHLRRAELLLSGASLPPATLRQGEAHLLRAVQAQPDNATAHALLGRLYAATGRLDEAESHLLQGLRAQPELRLILARLYVAQKKSAQARSEAAQARDYFRRLALAEVDNAAARTQWAAALVVLEDFPEAAKVLQQGLGLNTAKDAVYLSALAELHAAWSDAADKAGAGQDERLKLLEQGLRYNPQNPRLLQRLYVMTRQGGDGADQARAALRQVLAQGKASATVHLLLGVDAAARGDTAAARFHSEQAYKLSPQKEQMAAAANNLAWLLAHADPPELQEALTLVNGALERVPGQASFLDTRGYILTKLKRWPEATADLEAVLRERPDQPELHRLLAECYRQLGQPDVAAAHEKLAQAKAP